MGSVANMSAQHSRTANLICIILCYGLCVVVSLCYTCDANTTLLTPFVYFRELKRRLDGLSLKQHIHHFIHNSFGYFGVCVCVCACVCVHACVCMRAHVHACMHACVCACVCVFVCACLSARAKESERERKKQICVVCVEQIRLYYCVMFHYSALGKG